MEKFIVNEKDCPIHLKEFLKKHGFSAAAFRTLKMANSLWINGKNNRGNEALYPNDIVTLSFPEKTSNITPQEGPLKVIYEDDYIIVLDKPAGVLTHPTTSSSTNTLTNYLYNYFLKRNIKAGIHPVSRLDKFTSGLVVFAKKSYIQDFFTKEKPHKEYLGLLVGKPKQKTGVIVAPIARKQNSIIERQVDSKNGKYSETHIEIIESYSTLTLAKFILTTGRTHQIRVHASFIGYPLYGDNLYGIKGPQNRHCLHSSLIKFKHPVTGEELVLTSPIPKDMEDIISQDKIQQD